MVIHVLELAVLDDVDSGLGARGEKFVGLLGANSVRDVLVGDDDPLVL